VRITEELLESKVAATVYKTEINGSGDQLRWPRDTRLSEKVGTNFANQRRRSAGTVRLQTESISCISFMCFTTSKCKLLRNMW
jgi:hypothetical protein